MSAVVTYRPLFKVCLWHAYYLHPVEMAAGDMIDPVGRPNALKTSKQEEITANQSLVARYSIADDFYIEPSAATAALLAKRRMKLVLDAHGFSLWLRARKIAADHYQPFLPLDEPVKLTFAIRVKNPAFFNFTQLDPGNPLEAVYYFSNLANNRSGNTNYLNVNIPPVAPPRNYASSPDRAPIRAGGLSLDVSALQTDFVRVMIGNPFHTATFVFEKDADENALATCRPDIRKLPSGLYELSAFARNGNEIPALKQRFFWNAGDLPADTFAVLEMIHLPGSPPSPYAWAGADQRLLSPVYTLWWQNRSTFWRYLFDTAQPAPDATNPVCNVKVETPGNTARLVSKDRLPLLNRYRKVRYCTTGGNNEEILLPNPDANRLYPEGNEFFSEVYMSKIDYQKIIPGTS